ncbi:hypothetical protein PYW08_006368 [Mythimna loreyi]|uniref:Uncharacterized protein n=1 Tax=Mythimna loreyi TaxID=667449 RepID=A0ACC2QSK7_9NEOP|nr:hypothetical protein PYW08_006368 [Mythimna loreyi]
MPLFVYNQLHRCIALRRGFANPLFTCEQQMANDCGKMKTPPRENIIDYDSYFMALAFLARHRSRDPNYQVGACIVNEDRKIMAIGYNGFPAGSAYAHSWDPKTRESLGKHLYVVHAEMNALIFRNTADVKGCTMYVTLSPCNDCAKAIIQSGIKKVIYFSGEKMHKEEFRAAFDIFQKGERKVEFKKFYDVVKEPTIEFNTVNLAHENPLNIKLCAPEPSNLNEYFSE